MAEYPVKNNKKFKFQIENWNSCVDLEKIGSLYTNLIPKT